MSCSGRKYPLIQPKHWKPPVPRYKLVIPDEVKEIQILYLGVQSTSDSSSEVYHSAIEKLESWIHDSNPPEAVHPFKVVNGHDLPGSHVWACYWTSPTAFSQKLSSLDLVSLHTSFGCQRSTVGIWRESFTFPPTRFETNYAGLHESPGVAALGMDREQHTLSAYWGAARDRIPEAATDLFDYPSPASLTTPPPTPPKGLNQRLTGTNYDNMIHIRSGQCWAQCPADEAAAYETTLEPTLMSGMEHLWSNPLDTGTLGLRFLRNLSPTTGQEVKETCGAGFFRNWKDLERWSSRHPSHLAIFNGAHRHAREWGPDRKFMTWHEVAVLKAGEVRVEYVNCDPRTGVMRWVQLDVQELGEETAMAKVNGSAG